MTEYARIDKDDLTLSLPLPPSTNKRLTISNKTSEKTGKHFFVLYPEAKAYLEEWGMVLKSWRRRNKWDPLAVYWPARFYFRLRNGQQDSHNLLKILCDTMQRGEIFANDLYIMPNVAAVCVEPSNPGVLIQIPVKTPYPALQKGESK